MPASEFVKAVDAIQASLRPLLKSRGYKVRGRTFNHQTADGLTHVVNFQMGPSDPPGTTYIPGLRENLHGLFTINLGVYVPEVAAEQGGAAGSWVQDYHCCIRDRLGRTAGPPQEAWWHARLSPSVTSDIEACLLGFGLPFLDRFATRDLILPELRGRANLDYCAVPRIVSALILRERNETTEARALLVEQARETHNPHHPDYVRDLAERLGFGTI